MTISFSEWLKSELENETISDRTKSYMSEGEIFDPYNWENFCNALITAKPTEYELILDWAKQKEFLVLGRWIWLLVHEKMEQHATSLATADYIASFTGENRE